MLDKVPGVKVNFTELLSAVEKHWEREQAVALERLSISIQAIAKRQKYCQYHYALFKESTTSVALLKDRFERVSDDELSVRDVYEANSIAFLHNLHAMIDSFPFALNLIYRRINDVDSREIEWNKKFIKLYNNFGFFACLESLFKSEQFCLLKGYSNHGKHKHPIRIRNNFKELIFEDFEFEYGGEKMPSRELKVEDFMASCHDQLIPDFFQLINKVQEDVSESSL